MNREELIHVINHRIGVFNHLRQGYGNISSENNLQSQLLSSMNQGLSGLCEHLQWINITSFEGLDMNLLRNDNIVSKISLNLAEIRREVEISPLDNRIKLDLIAAAKAKLLLILKMN